MARARAQQSTSTAGTTYTIAENDFMANGGDGYPNFSSRMTSQDIMEEVVADYITANTPIAPKVLGGAARSHHLSGRRHGDGPELPIQGGVSLTSQAPVPRVNDRAGAPRLMAAGRRLLSAVLLGLVAARPARGRGRTRRHHRRSSIEPESSIQAGSWSSAATASRPTTRFSVDLVARPARGSSSRRAVTDGEGHFTVGATDPARRRRSARTRSRSRAQSGVYMMHRLVRSRVPRSSTPRTERRPGATKGFRPAERRRPGRSGRGQGRQARRTRARRPRSISCRWRPSGLRSAGSSCSCAGADDQPGPGSVRPTCPSIVR